MIHYVCSSVFPVSDPKCLMECASKCDFKWTPKPSKPIPESRQVLHPMLFLRICWALVFDVYCHLFVPFIWLKKTWSRTMSGNHARDIPSISGATALASDIQHGWRSVMKVVIGCNWDMETYDPPSHLKSSQVISSDLKSQVTCELKPQSPLWVRTTRCRCHILSTSSSADPHWPVQRLRCSDAVEWLVSLADCKLRKGLPSVQHVLTCLTGKSSAIPAIPAHTYFVGFHWFHVRWCPSTISGRRVFTLDQSSVPIFATRPYAYLERRLQWIQEVAARGHIRLGNHS